MSTEQPSKRKPAKIILPILLIGIVVVGYNYWSNSKRYETTDNAQIEAHAVPVLARVSGYVDSIALDDYDSVQVGSLLVRLDPREFEIAVRQSEADLASAEADYSSAKANLDQLEAALRVARANRSVQEVRTAKAIRDDQRDQQLKKESAISDKQADDSRSNREAADRQLNVVDDQIRQAEVQLESARASIQKAEANKKVRQAQVDQAKLRLSYCHIEAPAAGKAGKLNLNKGQYIQAGQNLFTLVNNQDFWVVANFKETQLERLKAGQKVEIKLDGYPEHPLEGRISNFSEATGAKFSLLPPDNATGNFIKVTQRVPVQIKLDLKSGEKEMLKAGLSAEVKVYVAD